MLEPEIPGNTGNIGRTCAATGSTLHLIEPLGFILNDKMLKRSGMDYWKDLDVRKYNDYEDFLSQNPDAINNTFMATTKALNTYCDVKYNSDSYIMFGKESGGIPEEILLTNKDKCVRIPMLEGTRSLNLANSVNIILYEALRQNNFNDMELEGKLHRHSWN